MSQQLSEEEQKEKEQKEKEREEREKQWKKEKRKRRILEIILIIIIIIILLLRRCSRWERVTPDYPPQGTEAQQEKIDGDDSDKMDSEEGGGAINVTYSTDVVVDMTAGTVSLYYANPNASNQNVSILITIDDLVVAKSDLITPGNQVTELPLESQAAEKLMEGGYDAELVVRSYDPENGEKAMIDTKGKITVTVVE